MTGVSPPTVSVLMTLYNRESYAAAAIESVLAQQFSDFELIIIDDHSTDGSLAIARHYAARDPRIRVETNEHNLGDYANRNRAASFARGHYLKFHDSDDLMYPHCLAVMVPLLESEPEAGFALSASQEWPGGPVPMVLSPRQCYQREFLGFGAFMGGPASALFRRTVFESLGGFVDHGVASDHLFWLRACTTTTVVLVPANLFWYRIHAGQEIASARAVREYARVHQLVWAALHHTACPLDGDELRRARINQTWTVAKQTWRDVRAGRLAMAGYRLRHAGLSAVDWLRYLRRPRRSALAGTPLDAEGQFVVPRWLAAPHRPPNTE